MHQLSMHNLQRDNAPIVLTIGLRGAKSVFIKCYLFCRHSSRTLMQWVAAGKMSLEDSSAHML